MAYNCIIFDGDSYQLKKLNKLSGQLSWLNKLFVNQLRMD